MKKYHICSSVVKERHFPWSSIPRVSDLNCFAFEAVTLPGHAQVVDPSDVTKPRANRGRVNLV